MSSLLPTQSLMAHTCETRLGKARGSGGSPSERGGHMRPSQYCVLLASDAVSALPLRSWFVGTPQGFFYVRFRDFSEPRAPPSVTAALSEQAAQRACSLI